MLKIKSGSVILVPKDRTMGFYTFLLNMIEQQFNNNALAKFIATLMLEQLSNFLGHEYMHAELYLDNGWQMGAWLNGVHTWQPKLSYYENVHIYEPTFELDRAKFFEAVKKYKEKRYDFVSLTINTVIQLLALGNDLNEKALEEVWSKIYKNEDQLICSELIGRVYADLGVTIERDPEYLTPDDIAKSNLFRRVF